MKSPGNEAAAWFASEEEARMALSHAQQVRDFIGQKLHL